MGADPLAEVVLGNGATQALHLFFTTFVEPGDEVVVIEPSYDCYVPQIVEVLALSIRRQLPGGSSL